MARKKKPPAGIPEWMVTFGDMMSLLLCFFIMLFAMSMITPKRFQALADTLKQDFTGYAASSPSKAKGVRTMTTPSASASKSMRTSAMMGGQPIPGPKGESTEVLAIQTDGTTVRVVRFELGSYELTDQAKWELRGVLNTLRGSPQKIMVKGYAVPAEGEGENLQTSDLAFFRAVSVIEYFASLGLSQDFFDINVAPGTLPGRNVLPPGTDPQFAGASAEIILLNQTLR